MAKVALHALDAEMTVIYVTHGRRQVISYLLYTVGLCLDLVGQIVIQRYGLHSSSERILLGAIQ